MEYHGSFRWLDEALSQREHFASAMLYARDVDAQTLVTGDVVIAQRWLENAEANPSSVSNDFNWHGFAEAAATNAHAAVTMSDADPWATISVRVYERLASEKEHGASFELSGMILRAWMIPSVITEKRPLVIT